jgi:outer membrane protein OmpA-like peptidoglycan-associated protein
MLEGKVIKGKFTGYYYTNQAAPFLSGEPVPDDGKDIVHLYSGEIMDIELLNDYNPEEYLESDSLLLHNLSDIQLLKTRNTAIKENVLVNFGQAVLKNVTVIKSWEQNGKTYGVLEADFIGKVKKNVRNQINAAFVQQGIKGFLFNIWNFIKWLLIFGLIVLLLKQCESCNKRSQIPENQDCCAQRDSFKIKNDSLRIIIDRLKMEKGKAEAKSDSLENELKLIELKSNLNCFAEKIYFYGDKDELRSYSASVIDNLVLLLNKNKNLRIRIEGHINGDTPVVPDLDIKRANKIKNMLVSKGIDASRIEAVGLKGDFPIVPRDEYVTDIWNNRYNKNMRVEIKIIDF